MHWPMALHVCAEAVTVASQVFRTYLFSAFVNCSALEHDPISPELLGPLGGMSSALLHTHRTISALRIAGNVLGVTASDNGTLLNIVMYQLHSSGRTSPWVLQ